MTYLILFKTLETVALTLVPLGIVAWHGAEGEYVSLLRLGMPAPVILGSRLLSLLMGSSVLLIFYLSEKILRRRV